MNSQEPRDRLFARIAEGRTDLVFEWIGQGHAASFVDAGGTSLLAWCAYYGDVSAIRHLMSRGERLESLGTDLGLTAAAFHGHWRLCEFLLEHGADPGHADAVTGETALHAALCTGARPGCAIAVQVLLAAGADPNRATRPGAETGSFMRDCRTKGETALHRAAAFGSVDTIRRLIDAGAVIDGRDAHGDTPLGWASWYARPDDVLRALCHGDHRIREGRRSMEANLLGRPHRP